MISRSVCEAGDPVVLVDIPTGPAVAASVMIVLIAQLVGISDAAVLLALFGSQPVAAVPRQGSMG
jgi:hypothetical protein